MWSRRAILSLTIQIVPLRSSGVGEPNPRNEPGDVDRNPHAGFPAQARCTRNESLRRNQTHSITIWKQCRQNIWRCAWISLRPPDIFLDLRCTRRAHATRKPSSKTELSLQSIMGATENKYPQDSLASPHVSDGVSMKSRLSLLSG